MSCFVYVLSYSRALYIEFTIKQNLQTLEECHLHAFEELGIPKTIVYDNMKTVVLKREKLPKDKSIIHYNPAFADFAQHYDFHLWACTPHLPRAKGKVERTIRYIRSNFMQGIKVRRQGLSLEELNKKALTWLENEANVRIHKATNERPLDSWKREKPYLRFPKDYHPYTTSPFIVRYSTKDGMVQYKSNFYSIPTKFSRKKLLVREINKNGMIFLEIYHEDQLITAHGLNRDRGQWITQDQHLLSENKTSPKRKIKKNLFHKAKIQKIKDFTRGFEYYERIISTYNV